MRTVLLLIIAALITTACAIRIAPRMLSFTPAAVVIDYSNNTVHAATALAQQFCSSIGKDAQYVRTSETGWLAQERTGFFNCVESPAKINQNNDSNTSNMPITNNFK